jgi:hypothetical protein
MGRLGPKEIVLTVVETLDEREGAAEVGGTELELTLADVGFEPG